jgi:uncharacterized protein
MGNKLNSKMPSVRGVTIALSVIVILLAGLVLPSVFRSNVEAAAVNVALASNGGTASASSTYSSGFPSGSAINGDRKGLNWQNGGGWNDNTSNIWPDWLQVDFNGTKNITEIDVFTIQDNYLNPVEPTDTMTFSTYGITAFDVQYWNGSNWLTVPGGSVTGNNCVWRKFTFSAIAAAKIRVLVNNGNQYSRVVELEAWENASATPTPTPTPTPGGTLANFFNQPYTGTRNDFTGTVGYQFVPSQNITVTALGRSVSGTMNVSHPVRIWKTSDQSVVASITVTASSPRDACGYAYELLPSSITLASGTSYRIASYETSGGDQWRDLGDISNHGAIASISYGVCDYGDVYPGSNFGSSNQGYVPVTFYMGSTPSTPTPTPLPGALKNYFNQTYSLDRNNFTGVVGFEFIPRQDLNLTKLGRAGGASMTHNHTISLYRVPDRALLGSVTVTPSSAKDSLGYAYEGLTSSIQLKAGIEYRIISSEQAGGDYFRDAAHVENHSLVADMICGVYDSNPGTYPVSVNKGTDNAYLGPTFFFTDSENPAPTYYSQDTLNWGDVAFSGFLGNIINNIINNRIIYEYNNYHSQMIADLTNRPETTGWKSEMWGKWISSLCIAYRYNKSASILNMINTSSNAVLGTQSADGNITTYASGAQYTNWDFWGRKYNLLGLIEAYEITNNSSYLTAARRLADLIVSQVGPSPKRDIVTCSPMAGTPATTILEPMMQLYRITGQPSYLDFSNYIKDRWAQSGGADYINKALNHDPVASMGYPHAYVIMNNIEGLLELYRSTGNNQYLEVAQNVWNSAKVNEITIIGTGTSGENFNNVKTLQTGGLNLEGCAASTVLRLCNNLLKITGDPQYADDIERVAYNALLGAEKEDGSDSPVWNKIRGIRDWDLSCVFYGMTCCSANAPRALVLLPEIAVMKDTQGLVVNLYCQGSATASISGTNVTLEQSTDYPKTGTINFTVRPAASKYFTIKLRIPKWSQNTTLKVNGVIQSGVVPGTYQTITRTWNNGDTIELVMDMRGRYYIAPDPAGAHNTVMYGPIVLSRDSRFNDGDIYATKALTQSDGYVTLTPITPPTSDMWMAFSVPAGSGNIKLCDYQSAGDTFTPASEFNTWLPK